MEINSVNRRIKANENIGKMLKAHITDRLNSLICEELLQINKKKENLGMDSWKETDYK